MDNYAIMTNRLPTGLIRGYGGPQLYFTLERFMDIAAHRLGLDPTEIRRRNFIRSDQFPYRTLTGGLYDSGNYEAVLDKALVLSDYRAFREEQQRSRNGTRQGQAGSLDEPLQRNGKSAARGAPGLKNGRTGGAVSPEEA